VFFAWDILIEAGTLENDPVVQILKLSAGIIVKVEVKFPDGCHGEVKVRLLRNEQQLIPLNRDDWVTGDAETVTTPEYYELTETPTQLKFIAMSPTTFYDHTVTVRITILPKPIASLMPVMDLLARLMQRLGFM
jgi:hypothetical protein